MAQVIEFHNSVPSKECTSIKIKSIVPSNNGFIINLQDGTSSFYEIFDIKRIKWADAPSRIEHLSSDKERSFIYDNTKYQVSVVNKAYNETVLIYNSNGLLVKSSIESIIDVSDIDNGVYVVVSNNAKAKILKR